VRRNAARSAAWFGQIGPIGTCKGEGWKEEKKSRSDESTRGFLVARSGMPRAYDFNGNAVEVTRLVYHYLQGGGAPARRRGKEPFSSKASGNESVGENGRKGQLPGQPHRGLRVEQLCRGLN